LIGDTIDRNANMNKHKSKTSTKITDESNKESSTLEYQAAEQNNIVLLPFMSKTSTKSIQQDYVNNDQFKIEKMTTFKPIGSASIKFASKWSTMSSYGLDNRQLAKQNLDSPEERTAKGISNKTNDTSKLNTAVLAGVVSGVGFVIVIINLGVLFICRR
jgi:hypothetical protein